MHYLAIFLPNSTVTGMSTYRSKMNLFPWTVFLPEGFENGILRFWTGDYMVWGSIHLLPVFSKKRKFFGNSNCDFRNFSPKCFFWLHEWEEFRKFQFWRKILDIRELKQQRFWATDVNRKWTFCIIGQWIGSKSRANRFYKRKET